MNRKTELSDPERTRLADELADLKSQVKALRAERDETRSLTELQRQVEELKMSKARLTEDNDRKIRETEHKVGLLKTQQDHEVANARRETELSVREENLKADKDRFKSEMDFQRKQLQGEIDRIDNILSQILLRLPNVNATLTVNRGGSADDDD